MRIGFKLTVAQLVVVTFLFAPTRAAGQGNPGDIDANGRVLLQVYVAMNDAALPNGHPVPGARFTVSDAAVTIPLRADAAGIARVWLRPGSYRVTSAAVTQWDGRVYSWDAPIIVVPGVQTLRLSQANAAAVALATDISSSAAASGPRVVSGPEQASSAMPTGEHKDPGVATLLSFVIPGAGQYYNGQMAAGTEYLVVDLISTGATVYGVTCSANYTCADGSAWAIGGAVMEITNMIFSMVDAHHGATQFNREHGALAILRSARPIAGVGPRGETRLGISLGTAP